MRSIAFLSLLLLMPAPGIADDAMNAEIDHLLAVVAASDCIFIRNGKEHDADNARDHLSMKRRRGKRHFDSADEFIERIASKSSWSGKPYQIRCGDRPPVLAGDWFRDVLVEYRNLEVTNQALN